MQDYCSRNEDYHNGGKRLNSTSLQGTANFLSTEFFKHWVSTEGC